MYLEGCFWWSVGIKWIFNGRYVLQERACVEVRRDGIENDSLSHALVRKSKNERDANCLDRLIGTVALEMHDADVVHAQWQRGAWRNWRLLGCRAQYAFHSAHAGDVIKENWPLVIW